MPYKNMNDITERIKCLIDNYWKLEITEKKFTSEISNIFSDTSNRGLVMRGLTFKASFERVLGKKRIDELKKTLVKIDRDLYSGLLKG